MRLIVPIATRGRPMRLAGALHSLTTLASRKNEISYVVRVDNDDSDTLGIVARLKTAFNCEIMIKPRPVTLGQGWNEIVADREWEAAVVIADKHLVLCQDWDESVVAIMVGQSRPLARWNLTRAPEETAVIVSRKWYDAFESRIFPEFFPFWFSERWLVEVHHLAFNQGIPKVMDLPLTEPSLPTQGIRDLEFWFDFFARTREVRLREAWTIAKAHNFAPPDPSGLLEEMRTADAWQRDRFAMYYETRGRAEGEPSAEYVLARQRAEAFLASQKENDHA